MAVAAMRQIDFFIRDGPSWNRRRSYTGGHHSPLTPRVILRDLRHEPNDDDPADSNDGHASALSLIVF